MPDTAYKVGGLLSVCLMILWTIGSVVAMVHFNSKFNDCKRGWDDAHARKDLPAQWLYLRCESLAHEDTGAAIWPPVWFQRWNADYVAEAREMGE